MASHRVGGEVDTLCNRCKLELAHTILAMVGPKIIRVRCNTCGGEHVYRGGGSSASKPRSSSASGDAAPRERVIISFDQRLAGKDLAGAPVYSPQATYVVDQVVSHPTFGLGIVTAVRQDKVDIDFKAAQKTLVHGRSAVPTQRPAFQSPNPPSTAPADKPMPPAEEQSP